MNRDINDHMNMAPQWIFLTYVVAVEAAVAVLLTLPSPKLFKNRFASLISSIFQPAFLMVPCFWVVEECNDIYWNNEHLLMCTSEVCSAAERDRYERSIYKAQRNVIFCVAACLLHWCTYRICKYQEEVESLEEVEKRYKAQ